MRLRGIPLLCCAASVLVATAARAQPHEHAHLGVQLRASAGPGLLTASQEVAPGQRSSTHGFGAGFDVALGSMLSARWALDMDIALLRSGDAAHGVLSDTAFTAVHLGIGATYWLMPANFYLAGSLGLARSSVEGNPVHVGIEVPTADASDLGAGLHLALGKQFWLSDRAGLGAALSLLASIANNPIGGRNSPRTLFGAVFAVCASYH